MGRKFYLVEVVECEHDTVDGWPMVYGKGRSKNRLVYFQLDGLFLRQRVVVGTVITVTVDEVIGIAEGYFDVAA